MQQVVLFQEINDASANHKRLKFHNGHRSLVTIVSGTEIVKSSALPVDTEYTVLIILKVNERNLRSLSDKTGRLFES